MKLDESDCSISDIKERDYESMTLYLWSLMDAGHGEAVGFDVRGCDFCFRKRTGP